MKKNISLTLNDGEQQICKLIAKARFNNNRNNNVKNSKVGEQSNEFTDLEGIGGEVAFCKMVNAFPDFSIHVRNATEDKGDLVVNNVTIDVKTTKYKNGKLLAVPWKKSNVELYVLMVGEFPTYTYKGSMFAKDLLIPERIGNLGRGDTYIAEQKDLK